MATALRLRARSPLRASVSTRRANSTTSARGIILWHWVGFCSQIPPAVCRGRNLYAYVTNDPLNNVDPNGQWQVTIAGFLGVGGAITFGQNSGQWSIGGFVGYGIGAKVAVDPNNSDPMRGGLMMSVGGNASINIGGYASADVGATGPLGMLPSGRSYAPLEFEASAQLFSLQAGTKASIDNRGEVTGRPYNRLSALVQEHTGLLGPHIGGVAAARVLLPRRQGHPLRSRLQRSTLPRRRWQTQSPAYRTHLVPVTLLLVLAIHLMVLARQSRNEIVEASEGQNGP